MSSSKTNYVVQRHVGDGKWIDLPEDIGGAKEGQKAAKAAATETPEVAFRCVAVYEPIMAAKKVSYEFTTPDIPRLAPDEAQESVETPPETETPAETPEDADEEGDSEEASPEASEPQDVVVPPEPEPKVEAAAPEAAKPPETEGGEAGVVKDAPGEAAAEQENESNELFGALFDDKKGTVPESTGELF